MRARKDSHQAMLQERHGGYLPGFGAFHVKPSTEAANATLSSRPTTNNPHKKNFSRILQKENTTEALSQEDYLLSYSVGSPDKFLVITDALACQQRQHKCHKRKATGKRGMKLGAVSQCEGKHGINHIPTD